MKKILLTAILLVPSVAMGVVDSQVEAIRNMLADSYENKDTYVWSFMAMGDTVKEMRSDCEVTSKEVFIELTNWAREKGMRFSVGELAKACLAYGPTEVKRGARDRKGNIKMCMLPNSEGVSCDCVKRDENKKCIEVECYGTGEEVITTNLGCDIFVSTFMKKNNELAELYGGAFSKPGVYVRDTTCGSKPCYPILDVVLAPGLEKNARNTRVNSSDENTKIWAVKHENGKYSVRELPIKAWTNDNFLSVRNTETKAGWTEGVLDGSIIAPYRDVSDAIMERYAEGLRMFSNGDIALAGLETYDNGYFDIKREVSHSHNLGATGDEVQNETEQHGNGAIFMGKVANYDWLGHFLFGMLWAKKIGLDAAGYGADVAEWIKKDGSDNVESNKQYMAYEMGRDYAEKYFNERNADKKYSENVYESKDKAKSFFRDVYQKEKGCSTARCVTSKCGTSHLGEHDYVICYGCVAQPKIYYVANLCGIERESTVQNSLRTSSDMGFKSF